MIRPSDRVRDLMSREVSTLDRNEELALADQIMSISRIRHMPVVDEEGKLVGILSQRDLFRSALIRALGHGSFAQDRALRSLRVKDVMSAEVETASPDESLASVAGRMARRKIGCLPVVEDERLVGILSEADFVLVFAREDAEAG